MDLTPSRRQTKVAETLAHLAGEFLARESNGTSLITVTRADIAPNLKNATVYISVLPESEEEKALNFTKRQRTPFRDFLKEKSALNFIPMVDFVLDIGEKNRQRVSELI